MPPPPGTTGGLCRRTAAAGIVLTSLLAAEVLGGPSVATGGPLAERCAHGGAAVLAGPRALLVRRPARAGRVVLLACRRGTGRPLRLGATFDADGSTSGGARSELTLAAIGGSVVAAGFDVVAEGCLYEGGCAVAPRQVLRIADTRAHTLRRIPLGGVLEVLTVARDGTATFRVDEFACVSTYRTRARPGEAVRLLRRVAARVVAGAGTPGC